VALSGDNTFRLTILLRELTFMNISQTPYERAVSGKPLREGDKAFFATRHQHELHQMLLDAFLECEQNGMKKADLARNSGHSPAVITRLLSDPSNYGASTVAVLMAAMGYVITLGREKIIAQGDNRNYLPPLQRKIAQMQGASIDPPAPGTFKTKTETSASSVVVLNRAR
jgi:hypothetical protein